MNNMFNDGLTHESGKEFYAQAASNKPIIEQIAESVCERIRNGQYEEYSQYDDYGIYYVTDVSVNFPVDGDFNPAKDIDYDELDRVIDRALQENAFTHYHTNGGVAPGEGDTEYIIHLADDRRPSVYWDEESGAQIATNECLETTMFNNHQNIK